MKHRSFRLTHEDIWKLQNLQDLQDHTNVSETLRFCVDFAYSALCLGQPENNANNMLALVKRNNLMLRFLFIELTKMHRGEVQPLTGAGRKYLENLKQQLSNYIENYDERTPGL